MGGEVIDLEEARKIAAAMQRTACPQCWLFQGREPCGACGDTGEITVDGPGARLAQTVERMADEIERLTAALKSATGRLETIAESAKW